MQAPILTTARLRLEPATVAHAADYLDYNLRNRAYLEPWEPARSGEFYTLDGATEILRRWEQYASSCHDEQFLGYTAEGLVTIVNLSDVAFRVVHRRAFIGYSVDEAHQGHGYATEAAGAVIDYAFDALHLSRIETSYAPWNQASARVLRKLGFVVEGYSRDYMFINGAWRDAVRVAKINESLPTP